MTQHRMMLIRDERGAAAVELALVTPLMLLLFLGTFEITQLVRVWNKLDTATQAIANIIAEQKTATIAGVTTAYNGGKLIMQPFAAGNLSVAVASVTYTSSGAVGAVAWQVLEGGAASLPLKNACAAAAGIGLGNDDAILVKSTYTYYAVSAFVLNGSFTLTHTAYARPRNINVLAGVSSTGALTGGC